MGKFKASTSNSGNGGGGGGSKQNRRSDDRLGKFLFDRFVVSGFLCVLLAAARRGFDSW